MTVDRKDFEDRLRDAADFGKRFHQRAEKDFRFYASEQWNRDDLSKLREECRPALTFNQVTVLVNAVSGAEVSNRFEPRYQARTYDDESKASVRNELLRYYRSQCEAGHEESNAFRDAIICGVGCTETYMDYSEYSDGIVSTVRIPVFEVVWDPGAKKQNFDDALFMMRAKWIPKDTYHRMFPGAPELSSYSAGDSRSSFEGPSAHPINTRENWMYRSGGQVWDPRRKRVLVIEHQYFDYEPSYVFDGPPPPGMESLSTEKFDKDGVERLRELAVSRGLSEKIRLREEDTKVFKRQFWAGPELLNEEPNPINDFTYQFITGLEDQSEETTQYFGIMKLARDPQMWANKFLSGIIEIIGRGPKGNLLFETGVFENPDQARRMWSSPGGVTQVRAGSLERKQLHVVPPMTLPSAYSDMMEYAAGFTTKATGINPYFSGDVSDLRRTAASSVQAIQRQGLTTLSPFFDSLKRYRKTIARRHLKWFEKHTPEGLSFRVVSPYEQRYVTFVKDRDSAQYDIVVDEVPTSQTNQMELWQTLTEQGLLAKLMELGFQPPQSLVDIIPGMPDHLKQEMKAAFAAMQQQAQAAAPVQ